MIYAMAVGHGFHESRARAALDEMSKKLLANTVIENYAVEIDEQ
mgnify:CR=1 FL=1